MVVPDFNKQFVIETDASKDEIGAALMQEEHPKSFISKILGPRWQKVVCL